MGTAVVFIVVIGLVAIIAMALLQYRTELGKMPPLAKRLAVAGLVALARIHRRTPMDGVRTAEGGG